LDLDASVTPNDQGLPKIGIGPTTELSLRVSVATLSKVLFHHSDDGKLMLALERTATLVGEAGQENVTIIAKPFGGGVRLNDVKALGSLIGDFNFDSRRSQEEHDFRIQIRPDSWDQVKRFCIRGFRDQDESVLETQPERELVEEFRDAMGVQLSPEQYNIRQLGVVFENVPKYTESLRATGRPTVRIYNVFEVHLGSPSLIESILSESARFNELDLRALAKEDAYGGGKGRANAILAMPVDSLESMIRRLPEEERGRSFADYKGVRFSGNVLALFETVYGPKYQWLPS
jgi:hypothetical protein